MDCSNITYPRVTLGEGESLRERDESKTQVTVNDKAVSVHAPGAVGDDACSHHSSRHVQMLSRCFTKQSTFYA